MSGHGGRQGHAHSHDSHDGTAARRFLGGAFWIAMVLLLAEAAGGLLSHSLALLSDAGHMLADVLALGLAWYATRLAGRSATARRTYGFHRAGILAALFNAGTLVVIAGGILAAAAVRLQHPVPVRADIMWIVAGIGLAGNLYVGFGLGGGHDHGNLNMRSAWLHVVGDAAASAGVLLAGVLIALTGWLWLDPLVSAGIALLIARGAWRIVAETVNVLMEGTPPGVEPREVAAAMEADPAVLSVHHLHVWSLDGSHAALSSHLVLRDGRLSEAEDVVQRVNRGLHDRFGIEHATLQVETAAGGRGCGDCDVVAAAADPDGTAGGGP